MEENQPVPPQVLNVDDICIHCHVRTRRKGKILCSRCKMSEYLQSLSSTLPGQELKQPIISDPPRPRQPKPVRLTPPAVILPMPPGQHYTVDQVAEMVQVPKKKLQRWYYKGKIPKPAYYEAGHQYFYAEEDVTKIKEFLDRVVKEEFVAPDPNNPETQLKTIANQINKKAFSMGGKGMERSVRLRLGRSNLLPKGGLL